MYDNTVTSFILSHKIPANTLTNGVSYYLQIAVFDKDNTYSQYSSTLFFTCYLTPSFSLNIESNQIIQAANYTVQVTYTQAQSEPLNEWKLILYNGNNTSILSTDYYYASSTMQYELTGLQNASKYYIEGSYVTVHGMTGSTGQIPFSVEFAQTGGFYNVELENLCNQGQIRIRCNLISIVGTSNPSPPTYENNHQVDLTSSGSYVTFDAGFDITNDFYLRLIGTDFQPYQTNIVLENSDASETISIQYMLGTFTVGGTQQAYFVLTTSDGVRIPSNIIDISTGYYCIFVTKSNNIYNISVESVTV